MRQVRHHAVTFTFDVLHSEIIVAQGPQFSDFACWFQVFIHNPHVKAQGGGRVESSTDSDINLLSINQQVSAVCAGRLNTSSQNDILAVGTQTNLLVYDIDNNKDLFYKDVSSIYFQLLKV